VDFDLHDRSRDKNVFCEDLEKDNKVFFKMRKNSWTGFDILLRENKNNLISVMRAISAV